MENGKTKKKLNLKSDNFRGKVSIRKFEVKCGKLEADLTIALTPFRVSKKIKKLSSITYLEVSIAGIQSGGRKRAILLV